MTYYIKQGIKYSPSAEASLDIHNLLPAGNYTIDQDPFGNYFFKVVDSFSLPSKRYGDNHKHTDRIFNTFVDRDNATGVLLAGEKGSGKSLLAKCLSIKAAEEGMPTIIINAPWTGDRFNNLIQSIQQPCVVLFDEFEKVYNAEQQEQVLTLLDGTFPTKKLFVLTCNDKWRIDSNMRNRPGRIFYLIDFKGLSVEFVKEYCDDKLVNKDHIDTLCKVSTLYDEFNFDMLSAVVEDMNRYNESPQEVLELLNAKPEYCRELQFTVTMSLNGIFLEPDDLYSKQWSGNPLSSYKSIEYRTFDDADDKPMSVANDNACEPVANSREWSWDNYERFENNDLINVDASVGSFTFKNKDGNVLILSKVKSYTSNYFNAF